MRNIKLILIVCLLAIPCSHSGQSFGQSNEKYTKYVHETLPNGLDLIIASNPDSRVFAINILGKNRAANEPVSQEGITDFVNRMLISGADGMSAEDIQNRLDDIGATITANDNPYIPYDDRYTSRAYSFIKFETIDEYAADGAKLLYSIVAKPSFPEDEIAKTRKKVMGILGMNSGSTYQTCRDLLYKTLFEGHPFSRPVLGSQRSVGAFTRENLVAYHKHFYAPNNMIIAVVSNIDPDTIKSWIVATFGRISRDKSNYAEFQVPAKPEGITEVHEDMDKEQIYIYMGTIIPGLKSPDAPAINMAAAIASSHMGLNLREKQGLAYSVGLDVDFMPNFGWLVAAMGTGFENSEVATAGMISEINAMVTNEPSQEELSKAQNSTWGSMLLARAARINQAYYMCRNEFLGVGYDYENDYLTKIRQVTPDDIKRVARDYFDVYDMAIATAGKKAE